MKEHGEEAIHDAGELNVKIDVAAKLKVQKRINNLKNELLNHSIETPSISFIR